MNEAIDIEARAAEWLGRRDGGQWSRADQAELDGWLAASTRHRIAYLRLESVWRRADRLAEPAPMIEALPPRRWRWPVSLAASVALALGGGLWLRERDPSVIHATPIGGRAEVRLADGSDLALNTDTRVAAVADGKAREVWLDHGEVFFQIAHDPAHPFVVHAGQQVITVLGTKFLVRQEGKRFRVAVSEGRVRLTGSAGARAVVLTRGEVATATGDDVLYSTEPAAKAADDLAWRAGSLVFGKVALVDAAAEFNRYSRRKLIVADPQAAATRIGGRFATDNVEGFARLIETGLGLRVTYRPDAIIISS